MGLTEFWVTFLRAKGTPSIAPNAFSKVLTLGFKAEGVVKRSDFGMGKYVPIVSDATTITVSAAFELKK
jgi:polyisoprenoid-binding protein YceI